MVTVRTALLVAMLRCRRVAARNSGGARSSFALGFPVGSRLCILLAFGDFRMMPA